MKCTRRPAGPSSSCNIPGPTSGAPPIYDGRMNLKEAPPLAQNDLEH
jgi:hypothetical protein